MSHPDAWLHATEAVAAPDPVVARRVGWRFIALYASAYTSTCLLFLAPLLVTLALKINTLVGIDQAPNSLSLVTGVGSFLAIFANPFFGKLSDRTSSPLGMRRPWQRCCQTRSRPLSAAWSRDSWASVCRSRR